MLTLSILNVLPTLITVLSMWLHLEDKEMMLRWECFPQSLRGRMYTWGVLTPECMLKMPMKKHFLTSNFKKFTCLVPDDKIRKRSHFQAHLLPLPPGCLLKAQFLPVTASHRVSPSLKFTHWDCRSCSWGDSSKQRLSHITGLNPPKANSTLRRSPGTKCQWGVKITN